VTNSRAVRGTPVGSTTSIHTSEVDEPGTETARNILTVRELVTSYGSGQNRKAVVEGVSIAVRRGERVGLVGESGSGKTTLASSILRILPSSATVDAGSVALGDVDMLAARPGALRELRSTRIARIPQDPLSSLNPVLTIGSQMKDVVKAHRRLDRRELDDFVIAALRDVGIGDPESKVRSYPHELSGGMRQRVLIAMALLNSPDLLVADEPTTALDVTVQAQVIDLIKVAVALRGMALLVISHDIGVVSELCDRVLVMFDGRIVEEGPVDSVIAHPTHPYTKALLRSVNGELPEEPTRQRTSLTLARAPHACRFIDRCPIAMDVCETEPALVERNSGWLARCHAVPVAESTREAAVA
jgi:oligopeptide/dipeptide ABC transporter ATP-binding protein